MIPRRDVRVALERPHRLGMIGGDLDFQLDHCEAYLACLQAVSAEMVEIPASRALDLGTGGGVPGISLAASTPDLDWTLLDARGGRTDEVRRVVSALDLTDHVTVVTSQAQPAAHDEDHRESYDLVVARAFGPPSLTAECASGFLRVGARLVVSEPPEPKPDRWSLVGLAEVGLSGPVYYREDGGEQNFGFAVFEKMAALNERMPRLPARRDRGWPTPEVTTPSE